MTQHQDSIPYYHSNIRENQLELFKKLTEMLATAETRETTLGDDEDIPVVVSFVKWEEPDLNREWEASKFFGSDEITYGNHVMLLLKEAYGEEHDVRMFVFDLSVSDSGHENVSRVIHTLQLTTDHQKQHDEWWEANKVKSGENTFIAVSGDTDSIAYETEMLLHSVEKFYNSREL